MAVLAVIPARGGSKRIPKKNIKHFHGKPMISYAIAGAAACNLFDKIVVSTDSREIAGVAERYGAEAPFLRPKELADDFTPTAPVLLHALEQLHGLDMEYEFLCCIYPTAVFIRPQYILEGYHLIRGEKASTVFSVTSYSFPIFRALKIEEGGWMKMFWPEHELTRSQDLPEAYHDAGQFYWLNVSEFKRSQKMYSDRAMPVVIPRSLVVDIDSEEDWVVAENLYQAHELKKKGITG
jgi:pseudaminic acid cytidylyltransferase